jgi:arsenate reductase
MSAHWGIPDPAAVEGDEETKRKAFLDAFVILQRRISLLVNLPLRSLDRLSLQKQLADIGRTA